MLFRETRSLTEEKQTKHRSTPRIRRWVIIRSGLGRPSAPVEARAAGNGCLVQCFGADVTVSRDHSGTQHLNTELELGVK